MAAGLLACGGELPTAPRPDEPFAEPPIAREFRGLWVATVANIDWPSSSALAATQQRDEFAHLVTVAEQRGLNAIVLQVRAAGDALYPSSREPWARALTGVQGGDPGYDPLAFAVAQAHQRGLELHAWFNPFRAGNLSDTIGLAPSHLAQRRPDLVRRHCRQLWFDPGEPEVRDHAIAVVLDVVARYDIDAVHLDDFFYPYPDSRCAGLDFADSATYARYVADGGALARDDWRRANIDGFVERLAAEVHAAAPGVRVGISPFGIWRPGQPQGITGLDAFATIYADSRRWLQEGWVDYLAPQLYWSIASSGQSFPALLDWWARQNVRRRHLWPGLAAYRVADGTASAFAASEIPSQVAHTRAQGHLPGGATGAILYNASAFRADRGGFASALATGAYASRAIPPASGWLDAAPPALPVVAAERQGALWRLAITGPTDARWWLVRWRAAGRWQQRLVRPSVAFVELPAAGIEGAVVNAIDRVGNASAAAIWRPE